MPSINRDEIQQQTASDRTSSVWTASIERIEQLFNVPPNIHFISGTGFYGSNDPTNSAKALKEDRVLRIRLQSNQVHPIVLTIIQHICSMKQKHKIHNR